MSAADRIEQQLLEATLRLPEPGGESCRRMVSAGGKRLRPDAVLRSFGAVADRPEVVPDGVVAAAAAVELLHTATLVHDDLLDDSATRRGVPALHRRHGTSAAVVVGDALIGQSWRKIAGTGPENVEDLAVSLEQMCAGQAAEDRLRFDPAGGALNALRVAQLKTGSLLAVCCRLGSRLGGAGRQQVEAFGRFGSDFGIALQLIDDVLDVISDPDTLGKPCAADFTAGVLTLLTALALDDQVGRRSEELTSAERNELRSLFRIGLSGADAARAHELVLNSGAPTRTVTLARAFARRAGRTLLATCPSAVEFSRLPLIYVERQLATRTAPAHRARIAPDDATAASMEGSSFSAELLLLDQAG